MLASKPTLFFLATSLLAVLPFTNAAAAPAGEKVYFGIRTSNNSTRCLAALDDLSVTGGDCFTGWVATAGSAASTTPPVGTITTSFPLNGTHCLAANVTTTNIATVPNGAGVVVKPCSSADVTQQWGIRDGDGTIRLGNQNLCLGLKVGSSLFAQYTPQVSTCVVGNANQKWIPIPKPPGLGATGYEPGSTGMVIYQEDSGTNCLTEGSTVLTGCSFHDGIIGVGQQNFTLVGGSSSVGKGAPGPITTLSGKFCFDVLTQTANNASVDYLVSHPCNGSLTQQWQVNNDSTISLANTNKCVVGTTDLNTRLQIADCAPGNANQNWKISQIYQVRF
ncbi:hypothetical protein MVEN_00669000 [Mycena venus]|uniref:Ricin B lectin domain-containing protein n=1 Tax=Mycena venus TaxID=2733690 RepID=A0A8H6YL79_9AGAR|nr:hypothetical protein MVEN_00669000 [Mycena venus]